MMLVQHLLPTLWISLPLKEGTGEFKEVLYVFSTHSGLYWASTSGSPDCSLCCHSYLPVFCPVWARLARLRCSSDSVSLLLKTHQGLSSTEESPRSHCGVLVPSVFWHPATSDLAPATLLAHWASELLSSSFTFKWSQVDSFPADCAGLTLSGCSSSHRYPLTSFRLLSSHSVPSPLCD